MNKDIVVTVDMVKKLRACASGILFVKRNPNLTVEENINRAKAEKRYEDIDWWEKSVKTEAFVRYRGTEFRMGDAYQIFNPLTGQHTACETIEDAKTLVKQIAEEIVSQHKVTACKELINEKGDSAWIPVDFPCKITVEIDTATN